jgi:membrane protein YqaA with SNARE-associated domain
MGGLDPSLDPLTWRNTALITTLLDYVLHLDKHLNVIIQDYGVWTYLILFAIIFCETGLVVTPFLPGDSLLFAIGTFAALGSLDLGVTLVLLSLAAILGDALNYAIGYHVGPRVFSRQGVRFLNRDYLDRTHRFYERYGAKTIVIARFVPIIRTVRAVRGGDRPHDLRALRALQRGGGHRLDREPHPRGLSVRQHPAGAKELLPGDLRDHHHFHPPALVEVLRQRRRPERRPDDDRGAAIPLTFDPSALTTTPDWNLSSCRCVSIPSRFLRPSWPSSPSWEDARRLPIGSASGRNRCRPPPTCTPSARPS